MFTIVVPRHERVLELRDGALIRVLEAGRHRRRRRTSYQLRAAYAELVTVRQRVQAQLETARAETAALRSMANAARLLDDHPALARLRMIQAAPYGTKIVLGAPERAEPSR